MEVICARAWAKRMRSKASDSRRIERRAPVRALDSRVSSPRRSRLLLICPSSAAVWPAICCCRAAFSALREAVRPARARSTTPTAFSDCLRMICCCSPRICR
ncbi:hypothetical protein D3C78_1588980 [compost metagenome]